MVYNKLEIISENKNNNFYWQDLIGLKFFYCVVSVFYCLFMELALQAVGGRMVMPV